MKKIGVLRGGAWDGYEKSLKEGGEILTYIREHLGERWKPVDIFVDKANVWHVNGLPIMPNDVAHKVDIAWNTSHHSLSRILNNFSIPNVSVPAFSSLLSKSRNLLREHMKRVGVNMPMHFIIPPYQADFDAPKNDGSVGGEPIEKFAVKKAKEVFEKFGSPWIVKSFSEDISMGVHVANTFPELVRAIIDGAEHGGSILVEELIAGKAGVMHSISGFRGEDVYTLPFGNFSHDFSSQEREKLSTLAKNLHTHLGDSHYLKSHFILSPRGGIYITEVDFTPDFKDNSHFYESCSFTGATHKDVFEHILEQAFL